MFKKTLLALSVTALAGAANASTIYVTATDATAFSTGFDITADTVAAATQCTTLGATKDAFTDGVTAVSGDNDTLTFVAAEGLFIASTKAVDDNFTAAAALSGDIFFTANETCNVAVATVTSTEALKHSVEYAGAKSIEIDPVLVAGVGGYKDEDTITIEISGAKFDQAASAGTSITIADRATSLGDDTDITFTVLEITDTTIRFTVQAANPLTEFVVGGAMLQLNGLFIDSADLTTAASVAIKTYGTNTSGTKFDESAVTVVANLVNQYTAKVTVDLNAKIDVGQDRQTFDNGDTDTLTLTVEKNTDNGGLELVPNEVTYSIAGDFSWMDAKDVDADENGTLTTAEINAHVVKSGGDSVKSMAVNTDRDMLTVVTTAAGAVDATTSFTFEVPGADGLTENPMISVQDFTLDVKVSNTKANVTSSVTMNALTTSDAGEWSLNGSVIVLPYAPFGPNTQPIIRHTNAGTRTGDLTVRYMVEDVHSEWQSLSAADVDDSTPGVRNMLTLVNDALVDEGYDSSVTGFKVALEFVTDVPAKDVWVYGGAKVTAEGQDRIHLGTLKSNHN